jgi:hypothetical protein
MINNANTDTLYRIAEMAIEMHPDVGGQSIDDIVARLTEVGFSVDFDAENSIILSTRSGRLPADPA